MIILLLHLVFFNTYIQGSQPNIQVAGAIAQSSYNVLQVQPSNKIQGKSEFNLQGYTIQ